MADDSDLEKTESASPRRLEQARAEGRAPHSRELASFAVMLSATLGLTMMGRGLCEGLRGGLRSSLIFDHALVDHPERMAEQLGRLSMSAMHDMAPWMGLVFLAAVLAPLVLSGFLFSVTNLTPDFSRLSPLRGLANMFSASSLNELVKAVLKAALVGGLAGWFLWSSRGVALGLGHADLAGGIASGVALLQRCMYVLLAGMGVVVAIDVPFQIWRHHDSLRMTREELKQEAREADGDPQVKARIRQQQREAARRRMMAAVPAADVVVTNPTHYAVALSYHPQTMRAPRVVAKGGDLVALRIRGLAEQHGVPILEQPALARALFRHAALEQEIPSGLYAAVAEILAYIFQLRAWRDGQGSQPRSPQEVEVPQELAVPAAPAGAAPARPRGHAPDSAPIDALAPVRGLDEDGIAAP